MTDSRIDRFIARWQAASGPERANCQIFLSELCELLGLPRPDPARDDTRDNAYVFERRVTFRHGDGSESRGYIDLYKRGCFVLEAKKTDTTIGSGQWDNAMLRARGQAEQYARALPAEEGRPPFLIVADVGRSIELYSEFTRSGATYVPYPDPRSHRLRLEDLRREDIRERLTRVWAEPLSLDPTRWSARVTREIAKRLAQLAMSLEKAGHHSETVAAFLMRCLFTMFAEDVGLLPKRGFTELLESLRETPKLFMPMVHDLWQIMNHGGFSAALRADLLRFNGGLFAEPAVLPLDRDQIELLIDAARADWRQVEPAIFGTLLERALDPVERHRLGAHYTPRAYVERLVLPTVVEPLREDWRNVQAAALSLDRAGKHGEAVDLVRSFHRQLCTVRVLDPACGSGNFLYVTLEHLKRLEGEVLNTLEEMGDTQIKLDAAGTVDPHQLLGLETNPRAARIAEAVLWIGYLQWHFRTCGNVTPPQPVLKDFHNIERRDAVLAYDRVEYVTDETGRPVTRWDGRTYKTHPVTGEQVPDETARVPLERYVNPRKAEWPQADFVVGNPPFIGSKRMRQTLGDGYVDAIQATWPEIPEATDFVVRWWHHAALLAKEGKIRRFGFITTNSLRQAYVRRAIEPHLKGSPPLSLVFAISDHPWVDSADGAAVRIAMTVAERAKTAGRLITVIRERSDEANGDDDLVDETRSEVGSINPDLTIGADLTRALPLQANANLCSVGMKTIGAAFQISHSEAQRLGLGHAAGIYKHVRPYLNGRDWVSLPRGVYVLDFFGMESEELRLRFPEAYQYLLTRVKPERDHNRNRIFREQWWIIGHPRPQFRMAVVGLSRYVVTVETQKHRFFGFVDAAIVPDSTLVTFAADDAYVLGVLSSRLHVAWALAAGGRLGVGNDPRYNKTRCFETFPFPDATEAQKARIRDLAEQIDAHRKRQQAAFPGLTLTGIYNVLEKLRTGETLTTKEKTIHEHGLISVLKELHDQLDAAVFEGYGWSDLAPRLVGRPGATMPLPDKPADLADAEEELLQRLVALNSQRAAEESRGLVRWLRPEFQARGIAPVQTEMETETPEAAVAAVAEHKRPWPKTLPEQVQAVRTVLAANGGAATAEGVARRFQRARTDKVAELLETLVALGQMHKVEEGYVTG